LTEAAPSLGGHNNKERSPRSVPVDRREHRARWAALVVVGAFLAGCADPGRVAAGIPLDARGDPLPTLQGTVVDEAIRPLAGATVRFLGTDVSALTDDAGHYEIHRATAKAEDILVTASKPGFEPLTHQVQVSGHRSSKADFRLALDGDLVPHQDVLQHSGRLRCAVGLAGAGQTTGLDCEADRRVDDQVPAWIWEINPTPNLAGAVVEVDWEATTPSTETLRAWLRAPMAGGQGGEVVAEATGKSPLRLELSPAQAQGMGRWTAINLYVDLAEQQGGSPGLDATGQGFDAFASLFYVEPPPAGYRIP
jgi:hypothetical protein